MTPRIHGTSPYVSTGSLCLAGNILMSWNLYRGEIKLVSLALIRWSQKMPLKQSTYADAKHSYQDLQWRDLSSIDMNSMAAFFDHNLHLKHAWKLEGWNHCGGYAFASCQELFDVRSRSTHIEIYQPGTIDLGAVLLEYGVIVRILVFWRSYPHWNSLEKKSTRLRSILL